MNFNLSVMVVIISKFAIGFLYVFEFMRFNRAKRVDSSIELKFNKRSWAEIIVVLLLNIGFFLFPDVEKNVSMLTFWGFAMLIITFLHTRRFVAIGKKVIFLLEHPFNIKDLSRISYEKGIMKFLIKGEAFSIRFPLGDMETIMGRLSGKYFRKG